ncbi:MAG TPA: SEC-C metal-binding domain-containing protein [Candidatus Xenobia bacterium]|jgi:hypothetical protein
MRFTTQGMTFDVTWDLCDDPDCNCTNMRFHFTECEVESRVPKAGLSFWTDLDVVAGREGGTSPGSALVRPVIIAFLEHARQGLFQHILDQRADERHMKHYVIPREDIERGLLVPYQELLGGRRKSAGPARISFEVNHRGATWYIDDLYCARPYCTCENTRLEALRVVPDAAGRPVGVPAFEANLTPRGKLTLGSLHAADVTPSLATEVVAALRKQHPNLLRELRRRFHAVKEVATRSLEAQPATKPAASVQPPVSTAPVSHPVPARPLAARETAASPTAVAVTAARVGRNDPCPCGSGKKYKKCCL